MSGSINIGQTTVIYGYEMHLLPNWLYNFEKCGRFGSKPCLLNYKHLAIHYNLSFSEWGPVAVWQYSGGDQWNSNSSGYQVQYMSKAQPGSHNLIPLTSSSNKPCALCKKNNIRTATGLPTKTYYKCDACDVCLCRPQVRDCFVQYHDQMFKQDVWIYMK